MAAVEKHQVKIHWRGIYLEIDYRSDQEGHITLLGATVLDESGAACDELPTCVLSVSGEEEIITLVEQGLDKLQQEHRQGFHV